MNEKDYILIAKILSGYKNAKSNCEKIRDDFNDLEWLIDEFCYFLEKDWNDFSEKNFRDIINK